MGCLGLVAACGILVPLPGIEPGPPALGAWSLILQTTREVPCLKMFLRFESLLCGRNEQIWMANRSLPPEVFSSAIPSASPRVSTLYPVISALKESLPKTQPPNKQRTSSGAQLEEASCSSRGGKPCLGRGNVGLRRCLPKGWPGVICDTGLPALAPVLCTMHHTLL